MSVDDVLRGPDRTRVLVTGCIIGSLVGVIHIGLVSTAVASSSTGTQSGLSTVLVTFASKSPITPDSFDTNVGYTLRVLQSVGILLPLFTGLLRFTVDDQSDVGEWVTDYLFIGIFGLVLGGLFAALGAIMADTAVILKVSLLPVLLTFSLIGFTAMGMLQETDNSSNESDKRKGDRRRNESQPESRSETASRDTGQAEERMDTRNSSSTKSAKSRESNNYDDGDASSEENSDDSGNSDE